MLAQERQVVPYLARENFVTIRYEALVKEPEKVCHQMYEFLGCAFRREYLRYDPKADPYPDRWDWVPEASQQFDPWHAIKWQEQMSSQEIEHVTERAGEFITKYGYES
jgi:hypothetical protein